MSGTWVRSYESGIEYLEHLDGVGWYDAPEPSRRHDCKPQTRGFMTGKFVERCACGAARLDRDGHWMERNQRCVDMPPLLARMVGRIRRALRPSR